MRPRYRASRIIVLTMTGLCCAPVPFMGGLDRVHAAALQQRQYPAVIELIPRGKDITQHLMAALSTQPDIVVIPPGDWTINRTILVDNRQRGLTIRGRGKFAKITWAGQSRGTMFLLQGVSWIRMENLELHGTGKDKGDTLVQLRYQKGHGTFHLMMRAVIMRFAGYGVVFGSSEKEFTCADSRFEMVQVFNCHKAFWVRTSQGVNYHCDSLIAYHNDIVWHLEAGGALLVDGASVGYNDTFCQIDTGGTDIGVAATLNNVKFEGTKPGKRFQLLKAQAKQGCVVNINSYASTHSNMQEGVQDIEIGPGNHVNIRGSTFKAPMRIARLYGNEKDAATLLMEGCMFRTRWRDHTIVVEGPKDVAIVRNCRERYEMIEDRRLVFQGKN